MTDSDKSQSTHSVWSGFGSLLGRDLRIAFRERSHVIQPVIFFVVITSLFPLSMTPDRELLQNTGPGIIWVAALLSTLLALDSIFRSDYEDGSLEQIVLSPQSLSLLILAKSLAHWLTSALPLILVSPLLALSMHLSGYATGVLMISLVLGTPALSLIGSIGVGLTLAVRRNGVLMSLLVLPLSIPTLIFGTGCVHAAMSGQDPLPHLLLLAAVSLFSLALAPLATAAAVRISLY